MATAAVVNATVPSAPMFEGAGRLVPVWHLFFTTLLTRTGGTQGQDINHVTVTSAQISDASAVGRNVLTAPTASAARSAIGAGTSNLALTDVANALNGNANSTLAFAYDPTTRTIESTIDPTGVVPAAYGAYGKSLTMTLLADGRVARAAAIPTVPDLALALGFGL